VIDQEPTAGGKERSTVGDGTGASGVEAGGTILKGDGVGVGAGVSMAETGAAVASGCTVMVRGGFAGSGLTCAGVCSAGGGTVACSVCLEHAAIKQTEITANILFIIIHSGQETSPSTRHRSWSSFTI